MKAHYDNYEYKDYWTNREYEHQSEKIVLETIFTSIGKIGKCLDLGGGYGRLIPEYSQYCDQIILQDPSSKNLSDAKKMLASNAKMIQYIQSTADKIPLPDSSLDVLLMIRVLHHIPTPNSSFSEISRVLKPGGHLIIEIPNKIHFKNLVRMIVSGKSSEIYNFLPRDIRSSANKISGTIDFVNHHPQPIIKSLRSNGFHIISTYSVSNFRSQTLKKVLGINILLKLEKFVQIISSKTNTFFGPSIFVLAQKGQ